MKSTSQLLSDTDYDTVYEQFSKINNNILISARGHPGEFERQCKV